MRNSSVCRTRYAALTAVALAGLLSTGTSAGAAPPGGGAGVQAVGGGGLGDLFQQNTGLNGRQNNVCGDSSSFAGSVIEGQAAARCTAANHSLSIDTLTVHGGAQAVGGGDTAYQQNVAEQGRENNACGNLNSVLDFPGTAGSACAAHDHSISKGTVVSSQGAQAVGGQSSAYQQNTAQEGRQNNACGNTNNITVSGLVAADCVAHDQSIGKGTLVHSGGAGAVGGGGDGIAVLNEQNTAQEGRQNNACGNTNNSGVAGTVASKCAAHDHSISKGTVVSSHGAHATGGFGLGTAQQNIAQEGRQNNACGNANNVTVTGQAQAGCVARDGSVSKGTIVHSHGAQATGGGSAAALLQQNIAQDGRQNNACGNTDALMPDPGGVAVQCQAVDDSVEVKSVTHR